MLVPVKEGMQAVRADVHSERMERGDVEICCGIVVVAGICHSSAQNPAPSVGVSPTRPGSLFVMPPVDVATQIVPMLSRTTQPTVPWGR